MAPKQKPNYQGYMTEKIKQMVLNDEIFFKTLMPFVSQLKLHEKLEFRFKLLQLTLDFLYPKPSQTQKIKTEPLENHERQLLYKVKKEKRENEVKQEKQEVGTKAKKSKKEEDHDFPWANSAACAPMLHPAMHPMMYPTMYPSIMDPSMQYVMNQYANLVDANYRNSAFAFHADENNPDEKVEEVEEDKEKSSVITTEVIEVLDDDI